MDSEASSKTYFDAVNFLIFACLSRNNLHEKRPHTLTAWDLNNVPVGSPVQQLVEQVVPVEVQSLDLSKAEAVRAATLLEPEAL